MKKNKRFLVLFLIIIILMGTIPLIFNHSQVAKSNSQIKGKIEISNSSNEEVISQLTLSTEKTEAAMQNNSNVLQKAVDDVSNAGGGTITLPAGTYYFAPIGLHEGWEYYAIRCKNNVKIVGAGTDESNVNSSTILKPYSNNLEIPFTMFDYTQGEEGVYLENADFENFVINGEESTKSGSYSTQGKGFAFQYFKDCDWNNIVVKNTDSTGFGMDFPINSTVTNCVAIRCGKKASDTDVGASGFGIGTGYSEDESMKISNCIAIGNRKFGFFFEHQTRFGSSTFQAREAKGFIIENCVAKGNMYNFGGERAFDIIYKNCISENITNSDPTPLRAQNETAFYFGTNSRRTYLLNCKSEQRYNNITDTNAFYYEPVLWAADNSIIDSGESISEYEALEECDKASAIVMLWRFAGRPGNVLIGKEQVNTGYEDVPADGWYSDAVAWAYEEGILNGGESYSPSIGCNRADFITMLWRYAGQPIVSTESDYTDVTKGTFFYDAVNWAVSEGIIIPQASEFYPATPYTKAEILTLLYRYDSLNPQRVVVYDYWKNGGNDSEKVYEVKHKGDNVDFSAEAAKTGYRFIGWSTNENATTGMNSLKVSEDNIYLYALYSKDVQITYDGNGGDNIPTSQIETVYNKELTADIRISNTIPIKDGYIFKGWTDEKDSREAKYEAGKTYSFENSCTLYAVWEEDSGDENPDIDIYTLTVRPNGGTWNNSIQDVEINGSLGNEVNIPNPIPPKGSTITFDGNGGLAQETSKTSKKTFKDWTLSGVGTLNGTTFIFGEGAATITANYIDTGIEMPIATREGYIFKGWTDDESSTQVKYKEGETYTFDNDCTLYAVWDKEEEGDETTYLVKYNYSYNGGESAEKQQEEKSPGEEIDLDVEARKTGYEFVGWSTDSNAKEGITSLVMGDEDITLYAIFKKDITLNFIDYKGTEENQTEKNITIYNNDKGEITAPTINQYLDWSSRFWTISKNPDSEQTVESGGVITNIIENQTYFARYSKEIRISFDLNKGEGTLPETIIGNIEVNSNNIKEIKGVEIVIPDAEISREGFKFSGWMINKEENETEYEIGEKAIFSTDVILYAKWTENSVPTEDTTLPILEIQYDNNNEWTNKDVELLISAKDEDSGIEKVTLNDDIILEKDGDTKYIIKENGTYEIIAIDKAGNTIKKSIKISNIDKELPMIDKIDVNENEIKINFIDNESGIDKIEYSYDGKTWNDILDENIEKEFVVKNYVYKTGESYAILELIDKKDNIYFRAVDKAGNIGEEKILELNNGNDNPFNNENTTSNNVINNNIDNPNSPKEENNNANFADKWLPYAGKNTIIIFIIATSVIAIYFRKKYNDLKDVK